MEIKAYEKLARAFRNRTGTAFSADEIEELVQGDDAVFRVVDSINNPPTCGFCDGKDPHYLTRVIVTEKGIRYHKSKVKYRGIYGNAACMKG